MKISRSAIEQYIRCPLCFYQQRRLGLKPPSMVPLTLAVAVDSLLKNEFDAVRQDGRSHPLWQRENLNVRAFRHDDIEIWRSNFKGIRFKHHSGAEIYGAVDDVWENLSTGELHIVDYKSTSKQGQPTIDEGWGNSYKRQLEIYQWLFRQAGFKVSNIGYFLYVNGIKEGPFYSSSTDGLMRFTTTLIAYEGSTTWIENVLMSAISCLQSEQVPESGADCDVCRYFKMRQNFQVDLKLT